MVIDAVLLFMDLIAFFSCEVDFYFYDYQFSAIYILYALAILLLALFVLWAVHLLLTIIIKQKCLYFKIASIIAVPLVFIVILPVFSLSVAYNCVNTYELCQDNRSKNGEIAEYSLINTDSDYISEYANQLNPLGQAADFSEMAFLNDSVSEDFYCCYRAWNGNDLQDKFIMPDDDYFQGCSKVDGDAYIFYYDVDDGYIYYAMFIDYENGFFFAEYSINQDESEVRKEDFIQKSLSNSNKMINAVNEKSEM